jgi:hypothetical protein
MAHELHIPFLAQPIFVVPHLAFYQYNQLTVHLFLFSI